MLTIYKASAGSGKTFTLALRYITCLLGFKDMNGKYHLRKSASKAHRHILAITFTQAATAEMKKRIVDQLALLSRSTSLAPDDKSQYLPKLQETFGATEVEIEKAAGEALYDLLFDYGGFQVNTIDSFFQSVLRSFAREIELPGDYDIELDDEMVIGRGVGEMLSSITLDPRNPETAQLSNWLLEYMRQTLEEGKRFNLFNRGSSLHSSLVKTLKDLLSEKFKLRRKEVTAYFKREDAPLQKLQAFLREQQRESRKAFLDAYNELGRIMRENALDTNKQFYYHLVGFLNKHLKDVPRDLPNYILNWDVTERNIYSAAGEKRYPGTDLDATIKGLLETLRVSQPVNSMSQFLSNNVFYFGLLGYVLKFIEQYRLDNNVILLSDTQDLLEGVINNDQNPFIYERLGYQLHHFLIDEFQDTSTMQWQNLRPLLEESIANGNDNLIIGDEKQSIYRFRNSDPTLLATKVNEQMMSRFHDEQVEAKGLKPAENTNYRSLGNVVRFNNSLFHTMASLAKVESTYITISQQVGKDKEIDNGYVNLAFVEKTDEATVTDQSFQRMLEHLKRQLEAGYQPKDIAILVRKVKEGSQVVNFLLDKMKEGELPEVEITSGDSVTIASSSVVNLILSVLRMIDSADSATEGYKKNARELASMINRFEYFHSLQGVEAAEALKDALLGEKKADIEQLVKDAADLDCLNLTSLVERIVRRFVSEEQCAEQNVFITAFQDLVSEVSSKGKSDIHTFLQWWDTKGKNKTIKVPDKLNAITVCTIHSAKGLEWPCVHVPLANWDFVEFSSQQKRRYDWYDMSAMTMIPEEFRPAMLPLDTSAKLRETALRPQLEKIVEEQRIDNLNLLYVAFTRAGRELVATCEGKLPKPEADSKKKPSKDSKSKEVEVKEEELKASKIGPYLVRGVEKSAEGDDNMTLNLALRFDTTLERPTLVVGEPTLPKKDDEEEEKPTQEMAPYHVTDRSDRFNLTEADCVTRRQMARERGTFLHDVLAQVVYRTDLQKALRRMARHANLPKDQAHEYLRLLSAALSDKTVERWFQGFERLLTERPIMLSKGVTKRPDRVVWTSSNVIEIIDYKFGQIPEPDDPTDKKYRSQVSDYISYFRQMFPSSVVRGYLWYPESATVQPV
ncbi:MAG: UvrD-helicase domain-containing protein [Bacteroidales bacterium]|nr:UvrD-helicase domain-containing protein [Bacteroidales bacterium]